MSNHPNAKARRTFFIDSENHINTCLQGIESLDERDLVLVFHRESNLSQKQKSSIKDSRAQVEWILCQDSGVKNSLDVQLIAELSRRIACREIENGYIISQDQGYKPAIHYLLNRYADDFRFIGLKRSIDEFLLTDALISAETRQDIHAALTRHAGNIVGTAMYRHIRNVFDGTTDTDGSDEEFIGADTPIPPITAGAYESTREGSDAETTTVSSETENGAGKPAKDAGSTNGNGRRQSKRRKPRATKQDIDTAATQYDLNESDGVPNTDPEPAPSTRGESDNSAQIDDTFPHDETSHTTEHGDDRGGKPEHMQAPASRPTKPKKTRLKTTTAEAGPSDNAPEENSSDHSIRHAEPPRQGDKSQNLTSLPNIGLALAKRLEATGVMSPNDLMKTGSREAWKLLREQDSSASISWLYSLEGAIKGVAAKELGEDVRADLKAFCKQVS